MPYADVGELPEAVRAVLTPEAQQIFLAAFNDAMKDGNTTEPWALSRAWAAVGSQYQMGEDGTYGSVTQNTVFTEPSPLTLTEHVSILQTLDRESNGIFLGKEFFEGSEDDWNKAPLIFAQDHPDMDAWDQDPEAELKRIGGRLIDGSATGTTIETTGHPRLMTTFQIKDDEIEKGIADGKISTSNGFRAKISGGKLTGGVAPHHILFFFEDPDGTMPGDKGVMILNTTTKAKEEGLRLTDRLRALFSGAGVPHEVTREEDNDMTDKELEGKLASANKELADANVALTQLRGDKAKLEGEIQAKDAEIEKLRTDNLAFVKEKKDLEWEKFKGKYVPPGMVAGDKEAAARKEWDENPLAFTERILDHAAKVARGEDEGEDGLEFTSGSKSKKKAIGKWRPEHRGTDKEWEG